MSDDEAILKCIVSDIHFLGAKHQPEADLVLAANQIQRIGNRIDVGSALVGRISAIADGKVGGHMERSQCRSFRIPCGAWFRLAG